MFFLFVVEMAFFIGITSFDEYSNWNDEFTFGKKSVLEERKAYIKSEVEKVLTLDEKETIEANISQNVIKLADKYLETVFYYFFRHTALFIGENYMKMIR